MSTTSLLSAAESWERVYKAFDQVNFTAYDYNAVKQSLLDYLKLNYPENFNDYIESSQMVALIELFAYVAELISYRVDLSVHENLIGEATRKQSILRLAKLVSYTATRNLPLRGLVKITSVSVSEDLRDSQGNSLSNRLIKWNDGNNPLWKEQFFAAMNKVMSQQFGQPFKSFQIDDLIFQQYEMKNVLEANTQGSSFRNGVLKLNVTTNGQDLNFELVPADIDDQGVFERSPNPNSYFTFLYGDDGYGDASDTTGFMMFVKQGTLNKLTKVIDLPIPNRSIDVDLKNINDVDVWVQEVDANGVISYEWLNVPSIGGSNLIFNTLEEGKKYEIETLEDDSVRLNFGDGDFAAIPTGIFNIWVRQSNSGLATVAKSEITEKSATFLYTSKTGKQESCTLTYSLTSALQNSSPSETIEHIKTAAPFVYYTQGRMVNGQDYNSYMLRDPSILRLYAVNRTFAGQPKYVSWNDASGAYQNVKVFGNDARMYYSIDSQAEISSISGRALIDEVIEPSLADPGIYNLVIYSYFSSDDVALSKAAVRPRTRLIESATDYANGEPLLEKTAIQGVIDRHFYGEPDSVVMLDASLSELSTLPKSLYAVVNSEADKRIYDANLKMVTKNTSTGVYTIVPGATSGLQDSVVRQQRFGIRFNPDRDFTSSVSICAVESTPGLTDSLSSSTVVNQANAVEEWWTIEMLNDSGAFSVIGSHSGKMDDGQVGVPYESSVLSFLIGHSSTPNTVVPGDAFVFQVANTSGYKVQTIYRRNLVGFFEILSSNQLSQGAETTQFDNSPTGSLNGKDWLLILERVDGAGGSLDYWKITRRDFNLVVESPTSRFFFDNESFLVDSDTKQRVYDQFRILKSNLNVDKTAPLGTDHVYNVVSSIRHDDGEINSAALSISPKGTLDEYYSGDAADANAIQFLNFIGESDYVYFKTDTTTGYLTPIEGTTYVKSLTYVNDVSGAYVRRNGRDNLDFMWQHFTTDDRVIDPSPSNINDIYVITRGYYSQMRDYVSGVLSIEPAAPTSLELKNTYRDLIESKMISDTVVMHSGKFKLLFGSQAAPELRARFKIVRSLTAKLTGDQIRVQVLDIIKDYFRIENWQFSQSFYATELCAVIHKNLSTEISSVVLIPEFPSNYFGDLYHLKSDANEIFMSCCELENIEIVSGIDRVTLKQKS